MAQIAALKKENSTLKVKIQEYDKNIQKKKMMRTNSIHKNKNKKRKKKKPKWLKEKRRMDHLKRWKEWTSTDLCNWILGLNKSFRGKYKSSLKKNLFVSKVNGSNLALLDRSDLMDLGIQDFMDRVEIHQAIQGLIFFRT